jgi:hypothetical protein
MAPKTSLVKRDDGYSSAIVKRDDEGYARGLAPGQTQIPEPPRGGLLGWFRNKLGGWPGPEVAEETGKDKPLTGERVASGSWVEKLPWFLPYFDDKMQETAEMRLWYRRMWQSPEVKAAVGTKIIQVAGLDPHFLPYNKRDDRDKKIAKFVEWNIMERLHDGLVGLVWNILAHGCTDGYAILEKCWALEEVGEWEGQIGLSALKPKMVDDDLVLEVDPFRNVTSLMGLRYNAGKHFDPRHFLIYSHMPFYGAPTGWSDLRSAYGSFWMLDTILKLRASGIEKRALPMLLGTYMNPNQKPSLDKALALAKSSNWLSAPEGCKVEAINLAMGSDTIFAAAVKDLAHRIFLAIKFAFLQNLEASEDTKQGNSQVHKSESELLPWFLSTNLMALFNNRDGGLVRDIVDLNYMVTGYPKFKLSTTDINEQEKRLNIYLGLNKLVDLSAEDVYDKFDAEQPSTPEDTIAKAAAGGMGGLGGGMPGQPQPGDGKDDGVDEWLKDAGEVNKPSDEEVDQFVERFGEKSDDTIEEARWRDTPQSSWVQRWRYSPNELTLDIQFNDDAICRYSEIEPRLAHNFGRVQSKGKWVWREVYYWPYELIQDAVTHSGLRKHHELFSEVEKYDAKDWTHERGKHGGSIWRNMKTGHIVYGSKNPGGTDRDPTLTHDNPDHSKDEDKDRQREEHSRIREERRRMRHPQLFEPAAKGGGTLEPKLQELAKDIPPEKRGLWHKLKKHVTMASMRAATGLMNMHYSLSKLNEKSLGVLEDVTNDVLGFGIDDATRISTDLLEDQTGFGTPTIMKAVAAVSSHVYAHVKHKYFQKEEHRPPKHPHGRPRQHQHQHAHAHAEGEQIDPEIVLTVVKAIYSAFGLTEYISPPNRERVQQMIGDRMGQTDADNYSEAAALAAIAERDRLVGEFGDSGAALIIRAAASLMK